MAVADKPDTFTQDKKDSITVQIANPRENDVKNVILDVTGNGMTATPSEILPRGACIRCRYEQHLFDHARKESPVNITVKYDNWR